MEIQISNPIYVESRTGWFRTSLLDGPDGVYVELWAKRAGDGGGFWLRLERGTIDRPLHVVLNEVHAKVWPLEPQFATPNRQAPLFMPKQPL